MTQYSGSKPASSSYAAADPAVDRNRDAGVAASRVVLDLLFGPARERAFDVRYWDGSRDLGGYKDDVAFTLVVNRRGALRRMLLPPSELAIAEAYISGDLDVEGELEAAVQLAELIRSRVRGVKGLLTLAPALLALPRDGDRPDVSTARFARRERAAATARHSDAAAIRHHYDVGNDFYALWLDPRMLYTCAYFRTGRESLHVAQTLKLEHICRKLRLRAGDRMLDIGCGWGGLVRYAARHHGVIAHGITLSAAQAEWAQRSIAEEGLADRCRVDVCDYRDLPEGAVYDKIASIGVTEHVAQKEQRAYFRAAYERLAPGGLFLNHCEISNDEARRRNLAERLAEMLWRRRGFIERYVFPDGALVPAAHVLASAEAAGFEVRDVESLREHYTETLSHWVRALEARKREAIASVGDRTYRIWRLYMAGAAALFRNSQLGLVQALLSKPADDGTSGLPWSREDLYALPYST